MKAKNRNLNTIGIQKALREAVNTFEQAYLDELERRNRPESEITVHEYMVSFLARANPNLQKSTYQSYNGLINGKIKRYFTSHPATAKGTPHRGASLYGGHYERVYVQYGIDEIPAYVWQKGDLSAGA